MIGQLDPKQKVVTVIGGGIAGLIAAYRLDQLGYEVTLHEARSRLGGWIETRATPWGIAEGAAHSILVTPAVQLFCDELGVELVEINPESHARYILRDGKLRKIPLRILEGLEALGRAAIVPVVGDSEFSIQTMQDWAERHLGSGASKYLISPMIRGIYGSEPYEISVAAAFPSLRGKTGHSLISNQLFFRSRSKKSSGKMKVPLKGMGALVESLSRRLQTKLGSRLKLRSCIEALPRQGNCILATPAPIAAELVSNVDPKLEEALRKVQYTSLVTATAFANASDFDSIPQGVGVLVPLIENRDCLGILFNSSSFRGRSSDSDKVSLTLMLGGSRRLEVLKYSDDEIRLMIIRELGELLGFRGNSIDVVIRRAENCIPQYNLALMNAWEVAKQGWCSAVGQILFGNYTGQVSIRGMIEADFGTSTKIEA